MKRKLTETKRVLATLLLAAMAIVCLSACASGAAKTETRTPWHPPAPTASNEPADVQTPIETPAETVSSDPTPVQTPEKDDVPTDNTAQELPDVNNAETTIDPASPQGVARLGELVGNYAMTLFIDQRSKYIMVDTESDHNPYDLTWRYGPDTSVRSEVYSEDWDELYRYYVDTCDWSLVFDAEYYKQAFPMLAKLYHDNDALLLEHFQTQGVHEGRQASADFNVAAYMENCDNELTDAFNENYECYYFYYMLNKDTQGSVDAKNYGGEYPRWLTLELSLHQKYELNGVNQYREKVGAQPVELDPEVIAFANYRSWNDAEYNVYAHDWAKDSATRGDVNDCMWRLGRDHLAENTVKWYSTMGNGHFKGFYNYYANSESHYAAMVSEKYYYFGCSNPYWSDNPDNPFAENGKTGYVSQFDMFTAEQPQTPYELD